MLNGPIPSPPPPGCDPIITEATVAEFKDPGLALKDTMVNEGMLQEVDPISSDAAAAAAFVIFTVFVVVTKRLLHCID